MALEQLADQVGRLGVELPRAVEGDRLGAVGVQDVGEDLRRVRQGGVPVDGAEVVLAAQAQLRPGEAVGRGDGRAELGGRQTGNAHVQALRGLDTGRLDDALDVRKSVRRDDRHRWSERSAKIADQGGAARTGEPSEKDPAGA